MRLSRGGGRRAPPRVQVTTLTTVCAPPPAAVSIALGPCTRFPPAVPAQEPPAPSLQGWASPSALSFPAFPGASFLGAREEAELLGTGPDPHPPTPERVDGTDGPGLLLCVGWPWGPGHPDLNAGLPRHPPGHPDHGPGPLGACSTSVT